MSLVDNSSPQTQSDLLLLKKKTILSSDNNPSSLRNVIKSRQEQEFKESKPFFKKYGSQNTNSKVTKQPPPESRQSHSIQPKSQTQISSVPEKGDFQAKNNTKQSFNKKLSNNIIKDEANVSQSKQSFRIKKVETKVSSPKKTRDDLIALNMQQGKLQSQIFQIHKNTKAQVERVKQKHKLQSKKLSDLLPKVKDEQGVSINWQEIQNFEKVIEKLNSKLRHNAKQLEKHQQKVDTNPYLQFLKNKPEDIQQMNQSEEEDIVQELPPERPRLEGDHGSYSVAMANLKQKNYALNLRRTYDVFKDTEKNETPEDFGEPRSEKAKQQVIKQQGQNRMTLNQKFKDFLLS